MSLNPNSFLQSLERPHPLVPPLGVPGGAVTLPGEDPAQVVAEKSFSFDVSQPWDKRPANGTDFLVQTNGLSQVLLAGAINQRITNILTIPQGHRAVIKFITIGVQNITALWASSFALFINNALVQGAGSMSLMPQVAPFAGATYRYTIHDIQENSVCFVTAQDNGGFGPWTVSAQFGGWWWPMDKQDADWGAYKS